MYLFKLNFKVFLAKKIGDNTRGRLNTTLAARVYSDHAHFKFHILFELFKIIKLWVDWHSFAVSIDHVTKAICSIALFKFNIINKCINWHCSDPPQDRLPKPQHQRYSQLSDISIFLIKKQQMLSCGLTSVILMS